MARRTGKVSRDTNESQVSVEIDIDGTGKYEIDTSSGMLDHMLAQLSRHGLMDLKVAAQGDLNVGWHHVVEDVGIVLGRAIREAVGDAKGITRMAHAYVPLDEALALSVVDFGGRGYAVIDADIGDSDLGGLPANLIHHFLEAMAREGGFNLHVRLLTGTNNHHKAEAVFKSLARACRMALTLDERVAGLIPSTKGSIG